MKRTIKQLPKKRRDPRRTSGLTLIEILVVGRFLELSRYRRYPGRGQLEEARDTAKVRVF